MRHLPSEEQASTPEPPGFGDGIFAGTSTASRVRLLRIVGGAGFLISTFGLLVGLLAPFPDADVAGSSIGFVLAAASLLGFAALAPALVAKTWLRFTYGVVWISLTLSVCAYYFGPQAGLLVAMGYVVVAMLAALLLPRALVLATILVIGVDYGVVVALQQNASRPLSRWTAVLLFVATMAVIAHLLGVLVSRLQRELEDANNNLERRVEEQVDENERLGRLRRFLPSAVATAVVGSDNERALEPHRRQIACVFIDLRGFTRFTSEAEPEEVIDALRSYHQVAGDVMARYEATVGPLQGDGMMAYFNDPLPCDDPTAQATEMALALKPGLDAFAETWRSRGYELSYGIGIAFGYATMGVVGFEGRQEYTPVGTVSNLASRLCDAAAAGQILMDQRTYSRVSSAFASEPLPPIEVKGFDRPVKVLLVTAGNSAPATIGGAQEDTT